jgi:phenylalanyl-tRNA synthetase alpha chain
MPLQKAKDILVNKPENSLILNTATLLDFQQEVLALIESSSESKDSLTITYLGRQSDLSKFTKQISSVAENERSRIGILINEIKLSIQNAIEDKSKTQMTNLKSNPNDKNQQWFDVTVPGIKPPEGHLHIVTQAIIEITRIFEKIGFTRVRHPEVDWDWYGFEGLNFPKNHPARDEWETFHILQMKNEKCKLKNDKYKHIILTPHTSNGQVREMEKGNLPIRMINIAKCYRRQIDVSHTPMFHQFEGLYVDKNVSIAHLKGVCDYFFKAFYGPDRVSRLRPYHFQFTEPSFEIDVSCGICKGKGVLESGENCRLCKEGWLELGGAGMVHPNVLRNGGIDPNIYSGFAFGWGVERTFMMKSGTQLSDIRPIYSNDIRFLNQF